MKVTYIYHSCFSIEFEEVILLFDYYKGTLPKFNKNKPLYIFASHVHADHFNPDILNISKDHPKATYILSNDIKITDQQIKSRNISSNIKDSIIYMGKNEVLNQNISFGLSELENTVPEMKIETLASTDEGVAFIISYQNQAIYYAGDLNWWHWEGESLQYNQSMEEAFKKEVEPLQGRCFDVAFLPLDPRLEASFYLGFDHFMRLTNTKIAVPMHCWKKYAIIQTLKDLPCAKAYQDKIIDITMENQSFILK